MTKTEGADQEARSRAYGLLSALFLRGPHPQCLAGLLAVDDLARHLDPEADPHQLEAEHQRVTQREVFVYESVMVHPEGLRGGMTAGSWNELRARLSLPSEPDEADHLGAQLEVLAALSGVASDGSVAEANDVLAVVMDHHLLRWLPVVLAALPTVDAPLYLEAAELAWELAVDHRSAVSSTAPQWALPPLPEVLDDPRTGLREIAALLVVPALAGGFFTRSFLSQAGRGLDVGTGFGSRADTVENLLRGASHLGGFPQLVACLDAEVLRWHHRYTDLAQSSPVVQLQPWIERTGNTRALLARLASP